MCSSFLPDLRRACLDDDPGNEFFWSKLVALERSVSLISKSEAALQGGKSDISDADAEQVRPPAYMRSHRFLTEVAVHDVDVGRRVNDSPKPCLTALCPLHTLRHVLA